MAETVRARAAREANEWGAKAWRRVVRAEESRVMSEKIGKVLAEGLWKDMTEPNSFLAKVREMEMDAVSISDQMLGKPAEVACVPGDTGSALVYASEVQVQAVLALLVENGALPRGVSSFGADLAAFARKVAEAVLGAK